MNWDIAKVSAGPGAAERGWLTDCCIPWSETTRLNLCHPVLVPFEADLSSGQTQGHQRSSLYFPGPTVNAYDQEVMRTSVQGDFWLACFNNVPSESPTPQVVLRALWLPSGVCLVNLPLGPWAPPGRAPHPVHLFSPTPHTPILITNYRPNGILNKWMTTWWKRGMRLTGLD